LFHKSKLNFIELIKIKKLKCPQEFNDNLLEILACLEEYFGSGCGVNSYLTPKNSQGFAPHYDDVK
jgi:bifunctional lysine-specific demethylase and histidyl-hydroxylase NO66